MGIIKVHVEKDKLFFFVRFSLTRITKESATLTDVRSWVRSHRDCASVRGCLRSSVVDACERCSVLDVVVIRDGGRHVQRLYGFPVARRRTGRFGLFHATHGEYEFIPSGCKKKGRKNMIAVAFREQYNRTRCKET